MAKDKFSAIWVSHSSMSDFLNCPRAYYLKNIWRNPETKRKVQIVGPALSLGSAVHEVVESLSVIPVNERFKEPLVTKFEEVWKNYSGKTGGFRDGEVEHHYKTRGMEMIKRITANPGPLQKLAVKIGMDLPHFWLSEEENIILCGKIDWLVYTPETDSVEIIDFKTSKNEERENSLQLPTYMLLATNCQKRKVAGAAYWYLENSDSLTQKKLPSYDEAMTDVLRVARSVKLARSLDKLSCAHGGCRYCQPLELIFEGKAELVGQNSFGQDLFLPPESVGEDVSEVIL